MTISSTTQRANYACNGVTTAFSFPYPFQAQADIVVVETVIATGVQTTKALTTDYTISGTPDDAGRYPNGGTINAVSAPAGTVTWSIYNDPDPTQETDLVENDPLPAETLEAALDKLTILVQRLNDRVNRSVQQPEGDSAAIARLPAKISRLGKLFRFNATTGDPEVVAIADAGFGDPAIVSGDAGKLVGVNSGETALEVKTAAQARTAIGATATGSSVITAADAAAARTAIGAGDVQSTRAISAGGLATGGGDLSTDRTITVPAASQAEAEAGSNNTNAMTPLRTAQAIAALATSTTIPAAPYQSGQQTITASADTTVSHGLGRLPRLMRFYLECTSADGNWSVGDYVEIASASSTSTADYGFSAQFTTSQIIVNVTARIPLPNKSTNVVFVADLTKWKLHIHAW